MTGAISSISEQVKKVGLDTVWVDSRDSAIESIGLSDTSKAIGQAVLNSATQVKPNTAALGMVPNSNSGIGSTPLQPGALLSYIQENKTLQYALIGVTFIGLIFILRDAK